MHDLPGPMSSSRPAAAAFSCRALAGRPAAPSADSAPAPAAFDMPASKPDDEDDSALVARCLRGDGTAWSVMVQRYQKLVYAIVRRAGMDEHSAADVFQTVFARLIQHLPRLADPSRLQAWIVTTAKREALLQRKLGQRSLSMTRADDDSDEASEWDVADESLIPEEALSELQQINHLRVAFDRLDERCRSLLRLLFRDEDEKLSYAEVAQRQGTTVGSIGPTRSRCLDKLRILAS